MNKNLPKVTLLIVVRNERGYIEQSLESFLNQTYPKELIEIIVVDGMSTDATREWLQEKVKQLQANGNDIKLLDNPEYILASGWNIGIKSGKGDIICRIDAHNEICQNYITIGVKELIKRQDEKAICVGGIEQYIGCGNIGVAIANLYSSRFGVGNAKYRTGIDKPSFTDTAKCGLYWKWIFDKVAYFDESLERNQDIALHSKILKNGYKFITHPDMKIKYYVRNTIFKFFKKAFADGYWVIASKNSYFRHKIPLFFVFYLFSIPVIFSIFRLFGFSALYNYYLLPVFLYVVLSFYFGLRSHGYINKMLIPLLFPVFHISYGLGSAKALARKYIWERLKIGLRFKQSENRRKVNC
jgi:glycosyltransferase involved in cell wall biosynthesis